MLHPAPTSLITTVFLYPQSTPRDIRKHGQQYLHPQPPPSLCGGQPLPGVQGHLQRAPRFVPPPHLITVAEHKQSSRPLSRSPPLLSPLYPRPRTYPRSYLRPCSRPCLCPCPYPYPCPSLRLCPRPHSPTRFLLYNHPCGRYRGQGDRGRHREGSFIYVCNLCTWDN